jgi:hypothetical protein
MNPLSPSVVLFCSINPSFSGIPQVLRKFSDTGYRERPHEGCCFFEIPLASLRALTPRKIRTERLFHLVKNRKFHDESDGLVATGSCLLDFRTLFSAYDKHG